MLTLKEKVLVMMWQKNPGRNGNWYSHYRNKHRKFKKKLAKTRALYNPASHCWTYTERHFILPRKYFLYL